MGKVAWDRLLETCYQRGSDLLFVPGNPILVRSPRPWQSLQLPALSPHDVRTMAAERVSATHVAVDGYAVQDFWYGDAAQFRATAFGYPETTVLLVSRLRSDFVVREVASTVASAGARPNGGAECSRNVFGEDKRTLNRFLNTCYRLGSDLLFVSGSSPMVRTLAMWRATDVPNLSPDQVRSIASDAIGRAAHVRADGYELCDFWYRDVAFFRAMAFGYPETTVLAVSRLRDPRGWIYYRPGEGLS
jgi:hypothetical protein